MMEKRSQFSTKLGFVLAAAGSAVGLGNIWRFPYLTAKYGGGMFLLVYIILTVTFGFTIMIAEIAIGRKTRLSPIGAYQKLNQKYKFIGVITALIAFLILSYYAVIGGWVVKYLAEFLSGKYAQTAQDNFFAEYTAQVAEPIFWQFLFIIATGGIVFFGVKNGIERVSRFLMPVLILLSICIAVYSITLPGAGEGVKYFLIPHPSDFSVQTVLAALGQMFYSLSLAMGIMITFGSYLPAETDMEKSVKQIEIFDTVIAVLAGLMIVPAVFAFSGGDRQALNAGPQLMFVTLPKVFERMGMSTFIGSVFFLLVFLAALTSAISLMEACVSTLCDNLKMNRRVSVIIITILVFLLGIPASLGYGLWDNIKLIGFSILDFMDFLTNSILMPVIALLTCIFVAYIVKTPTIIDEVKRSSSFHREKMFSVMIKYIAPICIIAILVTSILDAFGIVKL